MVEIKNFGIIYKINNKVNRKIYIGKTKLYYGKNYKKEYGIEGRFKSHIREALSNRKYGCKRLARAIRKYGKENFYIEEILRCDLDQVDKNEIEQIKKYNSTNRKIGYNIASGGKGRSVVSVDEQARKNISKAQNSKEEMNIKKYFKNGKFVGYRVKRREKGIQHQKFFTSTKYTTDENYQLAKTWLIDLINNKLENIKYNKESKLPSNIAYVKDRKGIKIIGYRVDIMKNNQKIMKSFQDQKLTLEEKFNKALEFKKSILESKNN
ncbi:GIY-YIG family nuclease [uncultured virus]|nr:GIY-YIG family nuclease [uncultured virus]